ncbi:MAG: ArnT family glycosyltransferase, partial [Candidatus Aminicenantia bacterium]
MKVEKFGLIAILILGFFLRFWGISSVYMRIDDVAVAKTIITVYNGYWIADPIFFYPPLLYYICAIVLRGISLFLSLIFFHKEPGLYQFTLSQVLFISRLVSAFFGFLTIPFLYLSLKKLYSEKTALLGVFIFSISFIHIIHSHQLVMDILSTFFVVLCFYFSTLILSSGKIIYYILAGLSAGLSVSSKYNGIISIFIIITAHFLREGSLSIPIIFHPKLILSGIFSITGFFTSHPFSLIRFKAFINSSKFFYNVVHKTEWYLVPIKPKGIIENIKYSKYFQGVSNLLSGEGLLIFFLILSGFLFLLILGKRGNLLLLSFPILYFLF